MSWQRLEVFQVSILMRNNVYQYDVYLSLFHGFYFYCTVTLDMLCNLKNTIYSRKIMSNASRNLSDGFKPTGIDVVIFQLPQNVEAGD